MDSVLVLIFAVAGNRSHDTGLNPSDIFSTAWPFLAGLAGGWALTRSWRHPHSIWPHGLILVGLTVGLGMVLRVIMTDGGAQPSFIMVATGVIAAFLLGRRALTGWIAVRRRP